MVNDIADWQGVPEAKLSEWRKLFNDSISGGIDMPDACPVCANKTLHRYYHLAKVEPRELRGKLFQGVGSYWEWCSSCHSYEHMHGYVPDWWQSKPLEVNHVALTAIPNILDAALLNK